MRVLLQSGEGTPFCEIEPGECFIHSSNAYLKFDKFINLSPSQEGAYGAEKSNGGVQLCPALRRSTWQLRSQHNRDFEEADGQG